MHFCVETDLVDTPPENGAFECLDGFHRRLDDWLCALPEGTKSLTQAMNDEFQGQALRVGASAGDLIICAPTSHLTTTRRNTHTDSTRCVAISSDLY
eukprot:SAG31_NODE_2724_length_5187_cov_2.096895_3_plen_97_part_00